MKGLGFEGIEGFIFFWLVESDGMEMNHYKGLHRDYYKTHVLHSLPNGGNIKEARNIMQSLS